ncbi:bifunctional 2-polyprenyl-6-hydroxyphenol methylase/3-demethylubiquinol 3-O-methyltransferase UbiG [Luteitalea sp. TBR-22]|uniref:class I SAM-dependent methyltransferase n=1 Tax=Luteitalea sp. TBR-22 TaxID=2802971 RepID=UPI001EF6DDD4|nr:class I SAM-dependent methyltransferase [Luteitalea sp. TBR-22]
MRQFLTRAVLLIGLLGVLPAVDGVRAQVREFDWYPEFRRWLQAEVPRDQRSPDAVAERYRARLAKEGVSAEEAARRVALLQTRRQDLENDFWNRFFTVDAPRFNTSPNAFLASVVEGRRPGRALDVGMGEGRNALFLAKLGWDVTGFDPADRAVALARERAATMKLRLDARVAMDSTFDFGREQWDLIVYSWVPPTGSVTQAIAGLKPGGIIVVEAGSAWFPPNGLLRQFEGLRVVHYEDRRDTSDFFDRSQMDVVRLVAEKR